MCRPVSETVHSAHDRRRSVSLGMMTREDGEYRALLLNQLLNFQTYIQSIHVFPNRQSCSTRRDASRDRKGNPSRKLPSQNTSRSSTPAQHRATTAIIRSSTPAKHHTPKPPRRIHRRRQQLPRPPIQLPARSPSTSQNHTLQKRRPCSHASLNTRPSIFRPTKRTSPFLRPNLKLPHLRRRPLLHRHPTRTPRTSPAHRANNPIPLPFYTRLPHGSLLGILQFCPAHRSP